MMFVAGFEVVFSETITVPLQETRTWNPRVRSRRLGGADCSTAAHTLQGFRAEFCRCLFPAVTLHNVIERA